MRKVKRLERYDTEDEMYLVKMQQLLVNLLCQEQKWRKGKMQGNVLLERVNVC